MVYNESILHQFPKVMYNALSADYNQNLLYVA